MKTSTKKEILAGCSFTALFILWTVLIQVIDVKPLGQNSTNIGFAGFNLWFHRITGVNMALYTMTDWLGLVPISVCMIFAGIGFMQLLARKRLYRVDADIFILGGYYIVIAFCYTAFEMFPINYRPVLIGGVLEASYPSSTTLLVLGVMPTLAEQAARRLKKRMLKHIVRIFVLVFSAFMVIGRLICGVHWFTDIIGSLLLCAGLFRFYRAAVRMLLEKN